MKAIFSGNNLAFCFYFDKDEVDDVGSKVDTEQTNDTIVEAAHDDTAATVDLTTKTLDAAPETIHIESVVSVDNTMLQSETDSKKTKKANGVHMKDQLLYLANLLGFEVKCSAAGKL